MGEGNHVSIAVCKHSKNEASMGAYLGYQDVRGDPRPLTTANKVQIKRLANTAVLEAQRDGTSLKGVPQVQGRTAQPRSQVA